MREFLNKKVSKGRWSLSSGGYLNRSDFVRQDNDFILGTLYMQGQDDIGVIWKTCRRVVEVH